MAGSGRSAGMRESGQARTDYPSIWPMIRLLYHLGPDFSGYKMAAMWEDAKIELRQFTAWERIAVVTDVDWIRSSVKVFGFAMPGHVPVFKNDALADAKVWLGE